jgi:hypothetical protein
MSENEDWLTTYEDTSWLDEPKKNPLIALLEDDVTPATKYAVIPDGTDPKYLAAVKAATKLRPHQRKYIRMLVKHGGVQSSATREYNKTAIKKLGQGTTFRWMHNPDFCTALAAARDSYLAVAGTDVASVLAKSQHVLDKALTPKPVLYKGEDTGFREHDLGTAARMIEFQGKAAGIGADENKARVTVQIIDMSGEPEKVVSVIDG